ncbi:MAG TPA: crosslink repair DNA glycosylase YcaQ family protein [Roseiflexaceae bacterium]|jgi:uncharacterized protein YcaQ|nr:crosslink repair DNA glycosylase YcaQ family protein [Roseiflexaceae bacterium]
MIELTRAAAQRLLLAAQGLQRRPDHAATKADVLAMIRQMNVLQIDTIHVVARSPYLVLWSRLGDYAPRWLDELLAEGALFEYWSHEACFLPIEDYPLYRRMMRAGVARRWAYVQSWMDANQDGIAQLREHIRAHGPVRSADFKRTDGQTGGWWNWKWEKRALEMLYTSGELMIARRERFHRIYDLRERVLPGWDDARTPSLEETRRALALKAVRALGVTPASWVADYFRTSKRATVPIVEQLAAEGLLLAARVEGWKEPAYIHPDHATHAEDAAAGGLQPELTTLLSPFDPLVWDRKRALDLFGFDYRIECYTPEPKRRYGYFTLPILHRGALVGRLDPKAHRKDGVFEIKALHLEPGVVVDDELITALAGALAECAAWHGTPEVVVRQSDPPKLAAALQKAVKRNAKKRGRNDAPKKTTTSADVT